MIFKKRNCTYVPKAVEDCITESMSRSACIRALPVHCTLPLDQTSSFNLMGDNGNQIDPSDFDLYPPVPLRNLRQQIRHVIATALST